MHLVDPQSKLLRKNDTAFPIHYLGMLAGIWIWKTAIPCRKRHNLEPVDRAGINPFKIDRNGKPTSRRFYLLDLSISASLLFALRLPLD